MTIQSLYIHIPYCRNLCAYCSFTITRGNNVPDDYINALKADWQKSIAHIHEDIKLKTIYFGGGTPSLLSNEQVEDLITYFSQWCEKGETEITIEANPTSLLKRKIDVWLQHKINRISMGIQSFSKETLQYLTRTHSPELSRRALTLLNSTDIQTYNVDLMMGMKTQSPQEFLENLLYLLSFNPKHISIYELTIEENTPFYRQKEKQRNEEDIAEMMQMIETETEKAGVYRYEISNYAQKGHQSLHNLTYWLNQSYIGIGCGSHSYVKGERFAKEKNVEKYIRKAIQHADIKIFSETLSPEKSARETLMLGLRMTAGRELHDFERQTGFNALTLLDDQFKYFSDLQLIEIQQNHLRLTKAGMRVANSILSEFI